MANEKPKPSHQPKPTPQSTPPARRPPPPPPPRERDHGSRLGTFTRNDPPSRKENPKK
jgi:hypothetical protein